MAADPGLRAVRRRPGLRQPRGACSRSLGDHRPAAVARASLFGMVSSSCSYAATAMAKSLFVKGADFVAVCGVHVRLDQPGDRAGHRAGGAHGLAVRRQRVRRRDHHDRSAHRWSAASGCGDGWWSRPGERLTAEADRRAITTVRPRTVALQHQPWCDEAALPGRLGRRRHLHHGRPDHAAEGAGHRLHRRRLPGRGRARPTSGTSCSSTATGSGPASRTSSSGRSSPSSASSARSATCPWPRRCGTGGISFGGVISFIFADLITFPLLLIYRRYYGAG